MAAEVHEQLHLFTPGTAPPINVVKGVSKRYPLLDGDDEEFELVPLDAPLDEFEPSDVDLFFYNPLHDLESLWWLGGYFVFDFARRFHRENIHNDAGSKTCRSNRVRFPEELFEDHDRRHDVMRITGFFAEYTVFLPKNLLPAAAVLEKLRRELMSAYEEAEKSEEAISKPVSASLYESFATSMRSNAKILSEIAKDAPSASSLKRSRNDETSVPSQIVSTDSKRSRVA